MSDIEHTQESYGDEENGYEYGLGLTILELEQELTMDEDLEVDRPDLWCASWVDLQQPIEGYVDPSTLSQRNTAKEQIHSLYMRTVEALYPQLAEVSSMDEFLITMAEMADLPPCDGNFSISYYTAKNGNLRVLTYVEAYVGEHVAMSIYVSDADEDVLKSYNLSVNPNMDMFGSAVVAPRDDEQTDREILEKVSPNQRNSLLRVMYGNLMPYEVEMKLVEIYEGSVGFVSETVLNDVIDQARVRYYDAIEQKDQEIAAGMVDLTADDLENMQIIINERIEQLG